jgi:histidinol-phosphate phosphatase family protein
MIIEQAVIFCGGKGLRLKNYTKAIPKPMVDVNYKPFLYHILMQLKKEGINNFLILTGYKSNKIKSFFKNGSKFGVNINYSWAPENWETGKRLINAKNLLKKNFLICYSDNFLDFKLTKHLKKFQKSDLTLTVIKKKSGNLKISGKNYEYNNDRKNDNYNFVELGYILANKSIIKFLNKKYNQPLSFFFNKIFKKKKVTSIVVDHYHSISTVKRLKLTKNFFTGKKILLLDRDGTINSRLNKGKYVDNIKQFKFINRTVKFLKILSQKKFNFIIITNQAGIGRGLMSENQLKKVHKFMLNELKKRGINILKIYICKHHWLDNCVCRKPKPYMIDKSISEYNLIRSKTIFVGDDIRDWKTAKKAGCNYIHMNKKINIKDKLYLGNLHNHKKAIEIIEEKYL